LANARQIGASLGISAADRGVTALPLFYSFGMSVLTSHVLAGSSVVVSDQGVLDPGFWEVLGQHSVTFLPGVPASYGMLRRLGRPSGELPALRALIQAGGRLAAPLVTHFAELMRQRGGAFFVMYGQTEAAPRIACLPPDRLPEKLGSAGVALEGGSLVAMDGDRVVPVGEVGEIVYTGPNVMMGYAESRDDLVLGDTQGPSLRTGDLGYVDADGFLFLTGRSKRIAKLAGARVSLDEVEAMVAHLAPVAAVDAGDAGVALFSAVADQGVLAAARRDLARRLQVPPTLVSVSHMEQLPLLGSGKVDYRGLTERVRSGR
jgi:acyl-CoA synthetase (AMP-forming)/AMP-acid ligase II